MTSTKHVDLGAETMRRKMKVTLNGFHGYDEHTVLVSVERDTEHTGDRELDYYSGHSTPFRGRIAPSAAAKFRCGMSDCRCGESMPLEFPLAGPEATTVEIRGNYPQS